jgi:1-acyl-sn-glycerol-3-phosphate acyltransferase
VKYFRAIFSNLWKIYVGTVFFTTGLFFYPFISSLLLKESWHKKTHFLFVSWSWSIRFLCFYHVYKVKSSPIPEGPYIVIANHSSYLDIYLMSSIIPNSHLLFLGKSELLNYPFLRTYFKKLHIPVFRNDKMKSAKSFVQAKNAVKKGWSLMIFPEGGIPDENLPTMVPFKEGAFKLAKNLKIPIVPITFTTNYKLLTDPGNIFGSAYPGISKVYIHEHISAEKVESLTQAELMELCFDIINEPLLGVGY